MLREIKRKCISFAEQCCALTAQTWNFQTHISEKIWLATLSIELKESNYILSILMLKLDDF